VKTTWKRAKDIERKWYLIDASDQILGRVATRVASLLIGKGKVDRVPNMDCGDHVVVVNADKIRVTGGKDDKKMYRTHSGYPGGFKERTLRQMMEKSPEKVMWYAVRNMLPNTKLRSSMIARLMVYSGSEHPHEAQKPQKVELRS
jgi:large subunit ribosomal protein L13